MGKFLPIDARPVLAFQWKSNSPQLVYELISHLHQEGRSFELFGVQGSGTSLIIGYDFDDQVRVDEKQWVVFDGEDTEVFDTKDFFAKYQVAES